MDVKPVRIQSRIERYLDINYQMDVKPVRIQLRIERYLGIN